MFIENDNRRKRQLDDKLYKVSKIKFARKTLSSSFNLNVKNLNVKPKSKIKFKKLRKYKTVPEYQPNLQIENTNFQNSFCLQTIPVGCVKTISNRKYR